MRVDEVAPYTEVMIGLTSGRHICSIDSGWLYIEIRATVIGHVVSCGNGVLLVWKDNSQVDELCWLLNEHDGKPYELGYRYGRFIDSHIECRLAVNIPGQKCVECGIPMPHKTFNGKVAVCVSCKVYGELDALEG
jgi:hypothetical protein